MRCAPWWPPSVGALVCALGQGQKEGFGSSGLHHEEQPSSPWERIIAKGLGLGATPGTQGPRILRGTEVVNPDPRSGAQQFAVGVLAAPLAPGELVHPEAQCLHQVLLSPERLQDSESVTEVKHLVQWVACEGSRGHYRSSPPFTVLPLTPAPQFAGDHLTAEASAHPSLHILGRSGPGYLCVQ